MLWLRTGGTSQAYSLFSNASLANGTALEDAVPLLKENGHVHFDFSDLFVQLFYFNISNLLQTAQPVYRVQDELLMFSLKICKLTDSHQKTRHFVLEGSMSIIRWTAFSFSTYGINPFSLQPNNALILICALEFLLDESEIHQPKDLIGIFFLN